MYPRDLLPVLDLLYDANVPAIIWGPGGAGKSSLAHFLAKKKGVEQFDLRLATQDVGEVVGMPVVTDPKEELEKLIMKWSKPEWWKDDDKEWILLLDEANRAERRLIQAVFQLITDRRIHTHVLPPGVRIFACCNPPGDGNIVNRLDAPFLSRFAHLNFEPAVEDLIEFCSEDFHSDVLNFLQNSEDQLMDLKSEFEIQDMIKRTPRTWEMASKIYVAAENSFEKVGSEFNNEENKVLKRALSSCIGNASAMDFIRWNQEAWTKIDDIVSGRVKPDEVKSDSDLVRLTTFLTTPHTENLIKTSPTGQKNINRFVSHIAKTRADLALGLSAKTDDSKYPTLYNIVYNNNDLLTVTINSG